MQTQQLLLKMLETMVVFPSMVLQTLTSGVNQSGNQDTSGNAATASALETARTLAISGDATGSHPSMVLLTLLSQQLLLIVVFLLDHMVVHLQFLYLQLIPKDVLHPQLLLLLVVD